MTIIKTVIKAGLAVLAVMAAIWVAQSQYMSQINSKPFLQCLKSAYGDCR